MGWTAGPRGPAVPLRRPAAALSGAAAAAAAVLRRRLGRGRAGPLRSGAAVPAVRPAVLRGSGTAAVVRPAGLGPGHAYACPVHGPPGPLCPAGVRRVRRRAARL